MSLQFLAARITITSGIIMPDHATHKEAAPEREPPGES